MYRKPSDGENRFGYKPTPFRMAEKKSSEYSSDHYSENLTDREKEVYIPSRTFKNSNWRAPQPSTTIQNSSQLVKKEMAAVNNFMPHFCVKKESHYTPSLKAVDNLTPKFLNMDLHNHNEATQSHVQEKSLSASPNSRNNQNSWRRPNSCSSNHNSSSSSNHNSSSSSIQANNLRRKFHMGWNLSVSEKKCLAQPENLKQMLSSKTSFYETLNLLHSATLKVQMDDLKREELACEHLKAEMIAQYPECDVTPYGIRLLGMAHPGSAIYMFFDTGSNYFQASGENKELQTAVRKTVFDKIKSCGHTEDVVNWDVQELVTFKHQESEMNCVVSFVNGFKDQNTLLLKTYLKMDKRLRLLMLLVSDMVYRYHDISKFFTSYVLNIMVIMYLQKIPDPILPSLQKLRDSYPYDKILIGGYDCGFPKDFSMPPSSNHLSVENLLKGFCSFYKDFNFEENVVSILGPDLKRSMFLSPFTSGEQILPRMNCDLPVIVQDPFEISCNAAEKVNTTVLEVFRMLCQDAFDILSKWC